MLDSSAAIEVFKVVVGLVGEDGRCRGRGDVTNADGSADDINNISLDHRALQLYTFLSSRRRRRGDTQ